VGVNDVHPSVEARVVHGLDRLGGLWRRVVGARARVVGVVNTCGVKEEDIAVGRDAAEMVGALLVVVSLEHFTSPFFLFFSFSCFFSLFSVMRAARRCSRRPLGPCVCLRKGLGAPFIETEKFSFQEVVVHLRPWRDEADDDEYPHGRAYTLLSYGDYYRYEPISEHDASAARNLMRPLVLGY
jgi:hypothetical protein